MRKGQREVTRKVSSEVLLRFPAVRFTVFSPDGDGRNCSAPKPGKEKQKRYDYCPAILMVHMFQSFLLVFTRVLRRTGREVTREMAARFEMFRRLCRALGLTRGPLAPRDDLPPMHTGSDCVRASEHPNWG